MSALPDSPPEKRNSINKEVVNINENMIINIPTVEKRTANGVRFPTSLKILALQYLVIS